MSTHKSIRFLPPRAVQTGSVIHLGNLHFKAKKTDVEHVLKDKGFSTCCFYWPDVPTTDPNEHKGWCRVLFLDHDTAERAKSALHDALLKGRPIKIGTINLSSPSSSAPVTQPTPSDPTHSIIAPLSKVTISPPAETTLPTLQSARAVISSSSPPPATGGSTGSAAKALGSLQLSAWPESWVYDGEQPEHDEAKFMSRMKQLEGPYKDAGIVYGPLVTQNEEKEDMLRSQVVPSPALKDESFKTKVLIDVTRGEGKDIEFKTIDLTRLAEFEADD
ncbi:hypothetical protein G7Z17_g10423 [Cylindrodendrum hubeiense]|uniref:RRM domain-containing protein n=1 Tax=Cylindrodendrum hubeiense TaxID=595255 RepID=A0A9P5LCN6_9HYPO|nr:hypothetical protein G7Z17_g10423 [Cylindrodendrum hubeiense]